MEPRLLIGADVKETLSFDYYGLQLLLYYYNYHNHDFSGLIPCLDFTPSVG